MAIDSAEKRRAAGGTPAIPLTPGVTPNVAKPAAWRAQSGWDYAYAGTPPPSGGTGRDRVSLGVVDALATGPDPALGGNAWGH